MKSGSTRTLADPRQQESTSTSTFLSSSSYLSTGPPMPTRIRGCFILLTWPQRRRGSWRVRKCGNPGGAPEKCGAPENSPGPRKNAGPRKIRRGPRKKTGPRKLARGPVAVHRAGSIFTGPAPFPVRGPAASGAGRGANFVPRPRSWGGAGSRFHAPPRPVANATLASELKPCELN